MSHLARFPRSLFFAFTSLCLLVASPVSADNVKIKVNRVREQLFLILESIAL